MSFATVDDPHDAVSTLPDPIPKEEEPTKIKFKSYKKKFLKMRHHFKDQMRENSRLYGEEHHATRIARRLQEQNDQLLDLLLDVNENPKIPTQLRYDLRSPTPNVSEVPSLEPDMASVGSREAEGARAALREARLEFDAGQISLHEYKETEASLIRIIETSHTSGKLRNLNDLCQISHTKLASVPASVMPTELMEESPTGYLSPAHEEEYLSNLDNYITTAPADSHVILPQRAKPTEKEREKDSQLHNPVSVYNWLRAHTDTKSVTHDLEKEAPPSNSNTSEPPNHKAKSSPKPPSSTGGGSTKPSRKRASSSLIPKHEPEEELLDEEGYVIGGGNEAPASKGKRKRDGDDAYRPKGGSSKSRKRPKGNGGAVVKKLEPEVEEEEEEP